MSLLYIYDKLCSMITQNGINIKQILSQIPLNTVVTANRLAELGVSHSLMRYYEKSGWLTRIATGAYTKLDDKADMNGGLYALQNDCNLPVHISANSALKEFYGKIHFIKSDERLNLFAPSGTKLPVWFKKCFGERYILYLTDFLPHDEGLLPYSMNGFDVKVPTLERALLELLYLVPKAVTVQEAYSVIETVTTIKTFAMQKLLEECTSVKVKRLLFCLAENAGLQWLDAIDVQKIELGSGIRTIGDNGRLYKKYNLVIPELE